MRAFFEGIQYFFVDFLNFWPYEALRSMTSWWSSNLVNWIFVIIGMVATAYWLKELKKFDDSGEEDKDITAHSYL